MSTANRRISDDERKDFAIAKLLRAKGRNPTPDTVGLFTDLLHNFPPEVVEREVLWCIVNVDGWVEPGRLLKRCGSVCEMTPEELAARAFDCLDDAVRAVGGNKSIKFDDPALNATVKNLGGWVAVCDTPDREWGTFFRQRFERVYASFRRHGVPAHLDVALLGTHARTNAGNFDQDDLREIERHIKADIGSPWLFATGLPVQPLLADHRERREEPAYGKLLQLRGPDDVLGDDAVNA